MRYAMQTTIAAAWILLALATHVATAQNLDITEFNGRYDVEYSNDLVSGTADMVLEFGRSAVSGSFGPGTGNVAGLWCNCGIAPVLRITTGPEGDNMTILGTAVLSSDGTPVIRGHWFEDDQDGILEARFSEEQ